MAVTAKLVKELRDRTGLGMMDCKRALEDAGGDIDTAIDQMRKKSALKAAKKAGRTTAEGLLGLRVAENGKRAALVEVNIETDFAARNEKFVRFVASVLDAVFNDGGDTETVVQRFADERETLVQEIGENIAVRRVARLDSDDGFIAGYLHNDQRKGAVVELSVTDPELARDLAMHVTAHDPVPLVVRTAGSRPGGGRQGTRDLSSPGRCRSGAGRGGGQTTQTTGNSQENGGRPGAQILG